MTLTPAVVVVVQDSNSLPQGQVALGEDGTLQVIPSMQQGEANSPVVLNTGQSLTHSLTHSLRHS